MIIWKPSITSTHSLCALNSANSESPLTEMDVRNLHRLVVLRSGPDIAGRYADQARLTDAGPAQLPIAGRSAGADGRLRQVACGGTGTPETAFTAHRRLVEIHPFNDGNGRTARLVMNLVLLRGGYPPVAVPPEDRPAYIARCNRSRPATASRRSNGYFTSDWIQRWGSP